MQELLWLTSPLNPFFLGPLDMSDVKVVEETLGVSLPLDYLDLLTSQNGGYLKQNEFSIREEVFCCEYLFGVSARENEGVLATQLLVTEWGLPSQLVALSGEGSRWFVLDYRHNKEEPSVSFLDLDTGLDSILAATFRDFIKQLRLSSELVKEDLLLLPSTSYSFSDLEAYVLAGDNAFKITDAFLFYVTAPCELSWLLQQCEKTLLLDNEFISSEVLYYVCEKLKQLHLTSNDKDKLRIFSKSLSVHQQADVKKYNQFIKKLIK